VRALVWRGERTLALEELPEPAPGDGEAVFEVQLAGICGSDLHPYKGHSGPRVPPLVLGHEAVGHADGGAFALYPVVGCGACARCGAGEDNLCASWRLIGMQSQGVFADRVVVPRSSLVPLPPGVEPDVAVLAEPLSCCVGALRPHELGPGTRVLVIGCGPIGLLTVFLAARRGAEVAAADPLAERRELALRLGAGRAVADAADVSGCDLAVDAAGFEQTWRAAIDALSNGGTLVVLGLGQAEGGFPMAGLVRRAIVARGQFASSRADFADALDILAQGDLDVGWVQQAPLTAGALAFENLVDRPSEFTKVVLRP
jgi:threonine dehydrogenase-like Zn-dependent dehydrogenase